MGTHTDAAAATAGTSSPPVALRYRAQRLYVRLMMWLVGRLLQAASACDSVIRAEVAALPDEFSFALRVHSGGAGVALRRVGGRLRTLRLKPGTDLSLVFEFKHITHAFLVLGFVEGTARAFANDRLTVGGDLALAMKVVRALDRMQCLVLPRFIAARAVKRYPTIALHDKLSLAARIYGRFLLDLFGG